MRHPFKRKLKYTTTELAIAKYISANQGISIGELCELFGEDETFDSLKRIQKKGMLGIENGVLDGC